MSQNRRLIGLTGCYGESRAGVALSQRGGWEPQRGRSSLLHRSTTSSSAGPQTPYGLPSPPTSHYLPDSSPSSPGKHFTVTKLWARITVLKQNNVLKEVRSNVKWHCVWCISDCFDMKPMFQNDKQFVMNMNSQESRLTSKITDLNEHWWSTGEFPCAVFLQRSVSESGFSIYQKGSWAQRWSLISQ